MDFSVASNWDDGLVVGLNELNNKSKSDKVTEVFGSSAFSLFGSANAGLPDIQKEEIEKSVKKVHLLGFKFNYLVNSISYPLIKTKEDFQEAISYFRWLDKINVDSITIANEDILKFVYNNFPQIKINVSIVMGIRTVEQVNSLRKNYPSIQRVILHHTVNRDKKCICEHVKNSQISVGDSKSIEIELLANEICLYNCPRMKEHYLALSAIAQKREADFDWTLCGEIRSGNVNYFLNSCWIRPEDIFLYQNLGVNMLKVAGRKETTNNLLMRASAYLNRNYDGNVMDLFLAEFWPNSKVPNIDNKELNGYIELLWKSGKNKISLGDKTDINYIWN